MAPPIFTHSADLIDPVRIFDTLFDMWRQGESTIYPSGKYEIVDTGRHEPSWHCREAGDGYFYQLKGNNGRILGWQWQAALVNMMVDEDQFDEHAGDVPREEIEGRWATGDVVDALVELPVYPNVADIGRPNRDPDFVEAGRFKVLDKGLLANDGLCDLLHAYVDEEEVIYQLQSPETGKVCWSLEAFLKLAVDGKQIELIEKATANV